MHASTGRRLDGVDHLGQSVLDILTTPVGTLPMRREYGSLLPLLIDQPFNDENRVRLYGAVAQALNRWERRLRLRRVGIDATASAGRFRLTVDAYRVDLPGKAESVRLSIPI